VIVAQTGNFEFVGGRYVYSSYESNDTHLDYHTTRLALAYDTEKISFGRFGPPDEVMQWASRRRQELRDAGFAEEARALGVVMLPRDVTVRELNTVLENPEKLMCFLQKVGIV
jgi:hypothetical protein